MTAASPPFGAIWPALALIASLAMLAAAHAFERFGGLAPCALCLTQREVYWGAAMLAGAGLAAQRLRPSPDLARAVAGLLGLAFLAGAVVALYHVGVEMKLWPGPKACAAATGLGGMTPERLAEALSGVVTVVRCDEVAWRLWGISMAGWNAIISTVLAGASVLAALSGRPEARA